MIHCARGHSVLTRHLVGVSSHVTGDVVEQDQ
jgi:hypothetical protein